MNKRKIAKRLLSAILTLIMLFHTPQSAEISYAKQQENSQKQAQLQEQISVTGTNALGNLLSDEITEVQQEQQENQGGNVFSIEMENKQATVSLETTQNAVLIVAVYDDSGESMLASGSVQVEAGATEAAVTIDIQEMPQYFTLCGYLVEQETLRPLSTVFESEKYTQEMSEFLEKTTEDFEEDRVLNLDEDITNNFAIYAEEVVVLTEEATAQEQNVVTAVDEESRTYVIENITSEVSNLQTDDIFSYEYGDNEVLIIKVANIEITGTTAVITGQETDVDEVFDYVKISGVAQLDLENIDATSCSEGVTFTGYGEFSTENIPETAAISEGMLGEIETAPSYGIDGTETYTKTFNHVIEKKISSNGASLTLKGDAGIKLDTSFEYILTLSKQYIELKFDYTGYIIVDIDGKAACDLDLATVSYSIVGVVNIGITPTIKFDMSASLHTMVSISGTVGFSCGADSGIQNLTTTPEFKAVLEMDASLYVGLQLVPKVNLIHDKLAYLSMTATVGGEITGHLEKSNEAAVSEKHECSWCVDGDIYGIYSLKCQVQFLDSKKLQYKYTITDEKIKWKDFYYCIDKNEFAFTVCPYQQYLITVSVQDSTGNPVEGAVVNENVTTGKDGKVTLWLRMGQTVITVEKDGYSVSKGMEITEPQNVVLRIGGNAGTAGESGSNSGFDSTNAGDVLQIAVGKYHALALMKDGSIYAWGDNSKGQFGNGTKTSSTVPVKITNNNSSTMLHENTVKSIYAGGSHSAALMKDGSLYVWGYNFYGQVGDRTDTDKNYPVKIMENVVSVSLGYWTSAAITEDGSLYVWGNNYHYQLGDETSTSKSYPIKIMENVVSASMGYYHSAAITEDGSLYMWGENGCGQLGDGSTTDKKVPVKVMNDVKQVSVGGWHSAAITEDGSLYTWGDNEFGQLGISSVWDEEVPQLVGTNVAKIQLGMEHSALLTKEGSLYVWGNNEYGQLGVGKTDTKRHNDLMKLLSNVANLEVNSDGVAVWAITKDGTIYAWGENEKGQLGIKSTTDKDTPTIINIPYKPTILNRIEAGIAAGTIIPATETGIIHAATDTTATNATTATVADTDTTVTASETTSKTAEFTGLQPQQIYNFYSMKNKEAEDLCSSANLLYIRQVQADENGELIIYYNPTQDCTIPSEFVVQMDSKKIDTLDIQLPQLIYNGSKQYMEPVITNEEMTLLEGRDYELSGDYVGKDSGTYKLYITGIGNYSGTVEMTYTIQQVDCKDVNVQEIPSVIYNGKSFQPVVMVSDNGTVLQQGIDYEVEYQNHTNAGYGIAIVKGIGNYTGKQICLFQIEPCELSAEMSQTISAQTYTGKAITPDVAIFHNGNKLVCNRDYTLTYQNHVNVGTAKVTINGLGNYTGTLTQTFEIKQAVSSQDNQQSGSQDVPENNTQGGQNSTQNDTQGSQDIPQNNATKITVGTIWTDSVTKAVYKVTSVKKGKCTVTYQEPKSTKIKKAVIPDTITIDDTKYKVTEIAAGAFKNCRKITSVVIGKNVKKIGKQAFYNCSKLKTITIKTNSLTLQKVGKNAFKGIHAKAVIKVSKKKLNVYKKILNKRGIEKKAVIKS